LDSDREAALTIAVTPSELDTRLAGGWTIPASWYSDPALYQDELDRIFARRWHLAGRLSALSKPGDHLVCQAGHIPVVVVRDGDSGLRGFVNVCRHRGHPVALEPGNAKRLQCRYHGWTYGLDGRLTGAPRCRLEPGFDKSELSLLPVAVDVWRDLVFVNPDPGAEPLLTSAPELDDVLAARGFDERPGFRFHGRWTYTIEANWKAWTENAIECYHCPLVHKNSFNDQYATDHEVYDVVNSGPLMGQFTKYRRRADGAPVAADGPQFRFCLLYPSAMLIEDDFVFFVGSTVPTGPDSCEFVTDTYVSPDLPEAEVESWLAAWNQTLEEDLEVVAAQRNGLRSGAVPYGRLLPTSESAIAHFHRLVVADLEREA
jgi:phenylpropionate dioxygenase-like ring-hydroxylating dioxygenase large terminal subunit